MARIAQRVQGFPSESCCLFSGGASMIYLQLLPPPCSVLVWIFLRGGGVGHTTLSYLLLEQANEPPLAPWVFRAARTGRKWVQPHPSPFTPKPAGIAHPREALTGHSGNTREWLYWEVITFTHQRMNNSTKNFRNHLS